MKREYQIVTTYQHVELIVAEIVVETVNEIVNKQKLILISENVPPLMKLMILYIQARENRSRNNY
jgi:hypothetical protein